MASRRIRILREDVANRIAAGEVIDRPLSIVRELMDNALDAGAASVDVRIARGGLDEVQVVDDGSGMDRADLEVCYLPHATSKIESVEDLRRTRTLGFRGEALSSIGLCATLEVTSRRAQDPAAQRLVVRDGRRVSLEPVAGNVGTSVRVSGLFEHLPGRREFLKSAGAESTQCAAAFLDKAVAFPATSFRFTVDGELRHFLPRASAAERVEAAYPDAGGGAPLAINAREADGISVQAVLARPEAARRDRRLIQVFANGRRIWEYSLVQAAEYGFAGNVPGGLHPVAFVFVAIDPSVVDFNVHPAKREARFQDLAAIHRLVVATVKDFAVGSDAPTRLQTAFPAPHPERHEVEAVLFRGDTTPGRLAAADGAAPGRTGGVVGSVADGRGGYGTAASEPMEVLGQAFGLFLVATRGERLFLIDQHAAHERVLFDRLLLEPATLQELLLPIGFEVTEREREFIRTNIEEMRSAGLGVELVGGRSCEVTALDARLSGIPEDEVAEVVCGRRAGPGSIRRALCAAAACAAAVKDGEQLEGGAAKELAAKALALPEPRCPHGRPILHALSRRELLRLVKREV